MVLTQLRIPITGSSFARHHQFRLTLATTVLKRIFEPKLMINTEPSHGTVKDASSHVVGQHFRKTKRGFTAECTPHDYRGNSARYHSNALAPPDGACSKVSHHIPLSTVAAHPRKKKACTLQVLTRLERQKPLLISRW